MSRFKAGDKYINGMYEIIEIKDVKIDGNSTEISYSYIQSKYFREDTVFIHPESWLLTEMNDGVIMPYISFEEELEDL